MAIRKFLNDHPDVSAKGWTTSDINREVVRPESKGTSKPYIDLYKTLNTAEGKPYVAPAMKEAEAASRMMPGSRNPGYYIPAFQSSRLTAAFNHLLPNKEANKYQRKF